MGFLINLLGIGGLVLIVIAILAFIAVIHVSAWAFLIAGIIALVIYFALTEGTPWRRGSYRRY